MRDSHDKRTLSIEGLPGVPGRPAAGKAKSAAQRQKLYRTKQQQARNNKAKQLEALYMFSSTYEVAQKMVNQVWLSIPGDKLAEGAKEAAKDAWQEIGRRMEWL